MLHPSERYLVDEHGERIAVLLGIEEYQRLLDELTAYRSNGGERTDEAYQSEETMASGSTATSRDRDADLGITFHPRSPDASPERLRSLMGIIKLTGPIEPRSWRFLDDMDDADDPADHARH